MFGFRATPASDGFTPSTHDAFTVHFNDLNGFIAHGPGFDGTSPDHLYKKCHRLIPEIGTLLHVHSPDQNKDADERVLIVVRAAAPEGFLVAYSLCKHEPYLPNERHWHVEQSEMNVARPSSFSNVNQTLDVHLFHDWKLEHGMTVNLTLPFLIDCDSNSGTTVRELGIAAYDSMRALSEAIGRYHYKSVTGNEVPPPQLPVSGFATPHPSGTPARDPTSSGSPKSSIVSPGPDEDKRKQPSPRPGSGRKSNEIPAGWYRFHDTNEKGIYTRKKRRE